MPHGSNQSSSSFFRIWQIVGDRHADPPIPPQIPIGRSTWWQWVREGKAPAPLKLGARTTAWRASDVQALIEKLNASSSE